MIFSSSLHSECIFSMLLNDMTKAVSAADITHEKILNYIFNNLEDYLFE